MNPTSDQKLLIARRLAREAFARATDSNGAAVASAGAGTNSAVPSRSSAFNGTEPRSASLGKRPLSASEQAERIFKLKRKRMRRTLHLINNGADKLIYTMDKERDLVIAYNVEKLVEELTKIANNEKFKLSMLVRIISERLRVSFCRCYCVVCRLWRFYRRCAVVWEPILYVAIFAS